MSPPLNTPGEHFDRLCDHLFILKRHKELFEVLTDLLNWLGRIFSLNDEGFGVVRAMLRDRYRSTGRCHANLSPKSPLLTTPRRPLDRLCDFLLNEKRYKVLSGLLGVCCNTAIVGNLRDCRRGILRAGRKIFIVKMET